MWVCSFDVYHSKTILDYNDTVELKERKQCFPYMVGHFKPDGKFDIWDRFSEKREAEEKVHYLNGGCAKRCEG